MSGTSAGESRALRLLRRAHRRREPLLLATVSGIATTNPGMIEWFSRETDVAILTTKSIQVHPNRGNREPVMTEPKPGCFGNAVGLKNPGVGVALEEFRALRERLRGGPLLNISLAGRNAEEFALLARKLAPLADLLELNLSCPHAHGGYGSVIGCNPDLVEQCTRAAVDAAGETPVFAKLTPNVDSPGALAEIARRARSAGAAGIVAINTVGPEQYREPETRAVILNNPAPAGKPDLCGRGGMSGRWIRTRALECVRAIREALGPGVPIIGMGGVETREDARAMREAGADAVGIGSALALVHQRDWPALIRALAGSPDQTRYRPDAGMRFRRRTVTARRELGGGLFELEVEGSLPFEAGQSCFLWLPGVGEKPFSTALAEPATFLVRRRGPVTEALGALERGDELFLRGPYGAGAGVVDRKMARRSVAAGPTALILAAGSGVALVPRLAERLAGAMAGAGEEPRGRSRPGGTGTPVEVWLGLRDEVRTVPLEKEIRRHASLHVVHDEGVTGRVLQAVAGAKGVRTLWAIGPDPFMDAAVELGRNLGLAPARVHISLEEEMLCGVGLCGMCHRSGRLTCQFGTFTEAAR